MARRPPKPLGVKPSPRFISATQPNAPLGVKGAIQRLKTSLDRAKTAGDIGLFNEEISQNASDRGAALILAADLENVLELCLLSRLNVRNEKSNLLRSDGPLGTFSNKILLSYTLDVIGEETKKNFDIIRSIRNAFAHSQHPIRFDTKEIMELCTFIAIPDKIKIIDDFVPVSELHEPTSRNIFIKICTLTTMALWNYLIQTDIEKFSGTEVHQKLIDVFGSYVRSPLP